MEGKSGTQIERFVTFTCQLHENLGNRAFSDFEIFTTKKNKNYIRIQLKEQHLSKTK